MECFEKLLQRLRVKMIVISVLSQDMKKPESAPANPRKAMILIYRDTLESYYLNFDIQ